jgi:hypothetical protein
MKITIMTDPDIFIHQHSDVLSVNKTAIDFAVQCVLHGYTEVSVMGVLQEGVYARKGIAALDVYGINRKHLRVLGAKLNPLKSGEYTAAHKRKLDITDWQHLYRQDCIVVSYANPRFKELVQRKRQALKLAIDFFGATAYYEMLNFMRLCVVSFIYGNESAVEFFRDYSSYLGTPIVIATNAGRLTVLYKGQIFRLRPVGEEFGSESEIDWTAFRAAFLCEWLKSKDIRKAMWQGAGAGFHTYSCAGVV